MCKLKTIWWVLVTLLIVPIGGTFLTLARVFQWLGEAFQTAFDWLVFNKHKIAPEPPRANRDHKMPKWADDDL